MTAPQVFYPQAYVNVRIGLPNGEEFQDTFVPKRVHITRRGPTHAGECEIELFGSALPLLVRKMEAATVAVYMGNASSLTGRSILPGFKTTGGGSNLPNVGGAVGALAGASFTALDPVGQAAARGLTDQLAPRSPYLRFLGDVDEPEGGLSMRGPSITLKCRDFSAYLHGAKPCPEKAVPRYGMPLKTIIERILDAVPGARGRLRIRDTPALRFATTNQSLPGTRTVNGYIALKGESSAWDAISQSALIAACLVTVELDEIVVRSAAEQYGSVDDVAGIFGSAVVAASDPVSAAAAGAVIGADASRRQPVVFLFGSANGNVSSIRFRKRFNNQRRGIRLIGSDPSGRKTLVAEFPADNQLPPRRLAKAITKMNADKPKAAGHGGGQAKQKTAPAAEQAGIPRDTFFEHAVHDQKGLEALAKYIFDNRRAHEITGTVESPFFTDEMLDMWSATRFGLVTNASLEEQLDGLDEAGRARVLARELKITPEGGRILARLFKTGSLSERFYAETVNIAWSSNGAPQISVSFLNLIPSKAK